ncbi:hypothetical protein LWI28_004709 [Acer negundo]|uniref:Endonuclease/exonuclease/phosphatase domain-containing protein n=1 Tax=Acer negundo TaxID=4023 RepID=A0AAD5NQQ2_ACENE|nr:hypothetical protein LWI28_004709 [Acer negundo]
MGQLELGRLQRMILFSRVKKQELFRLGVIGPKEVGQLLKGLVHKSPLPKERNQKAKGSGQVTVDPNESSKSRDYVVKRDSNRKLGGGCWKRQAWNRGNVCGDSGVKLMRGKRNFVEVLVDVSVVGSSEYGEKKGRFSVGGTVSDAQISAAREIIGGGIGEEWGFGFVLVYRVSVDLLTYSVSHIDVHVSHGSKRWRLTGFYGNPIQDQQCHTWTLLHRLRGMSTLPWLCIGDFNEILCAEEKEGGLVHQRQLIEGFREALDLCDLEDMGFVGPMFTWSNRGSGDGLGNRKQFHFESCWAEHEECKFVVRRSWVPSGGSGAMDRVANTISMCTQQLHRWNAMFRKSRQADIESLQKEIGAISSNIQPDSWNVIRRLESRLDCLLSEEEEYWKQRSKVEWLKGGDRNMKFFHLKASARKACNEIHGLLTEDGE